MLQMSGTGLWKYKFIKERMVAHMDTTAKIKLLEERFQKLASSEKENYGVCRKIRRDIRKLQKELEIRA